MRTLTHGYTSEMSRTSRSGQRWFLVIETIDRGTVIFCQAGENEKGFPVDRSANVYPWVRNVTMFNPAETGARDVQVFLEAGAWSFWQVAPLINRKASVYRYRLDPANCDLVHQGRIWEPVIWDSLDKTLQVSVVGYPATVIDGDIPSSVFTEADYPQCPESFLGSGVPILMGTTHHWTPVLVDAGGWGYLSQDIPALPSSTFTGYLPIDDNRAATFRDVDVEGRLTRTLNRYDHLIPITAASYPNFLQDHGAAWILIQATEIARATHKYQHGYDYFLSQVFRGLVNTEAKTHPINGLVEEVGLVDIEGEIALYRSKNTDSLTEVISGIYGTSKPHYSGTLVKQYSPTYKWLLAGHALKSNPDKTKLYFFNPSQNRLIRNPFSTYTEVDRDPAEIVIRSRLDTVLIEMNTAETDGVEKYEPIGMNSCVATSDYCHCWENAANAGDEGGIDPMAGDTPETYATYLYRPDSQSFVASTHYLQKSDWWSDPENGHDENDATNAEVDWLSSSTWYTTENSWRYWLQYQPGDFDDMPDNLTVERIVIKGFVRRYCSYDAPVFLHLMLDNGIIAQSDMYGPDTLEYREWDVTGYVPDEIKNDLKNQGHRLSEDIYMPVHGDHENVGGWGSACHFHFSEQMMSVDFISHGYLKARNTDNVSYPENTIATQIGLYIAGSATWVLTWDGAWGDDSSYEFTANNGWMLFNVPGSTEFSEQSDWQKYITLRPKHPTEADGSKVYHICLVHHYIDNGAWAAMSGLWSGDYDAVYHSDGTTTHILEARHDGAVSGDKTIKKVRVYIHSKVPGAGMDTCQVGIGRPDGSGSVTEWIDLPAGENHCYFDVTDSADGPGEGNWTWEHLQGDSDVGLAIFLKTYDADPGVEFRVGRLRWDVVTESDVDPESQPLVITECEGKTDLLGGPYGSWLIENPAYIEKYLLQAELQLDMNGIDIESFTELASRFNSLGITAGGAIYTRESADTFLKRFRQQFGYSAVDVDGKLAVKAWPSYNDDHVLILDESNTMDSPVSMQLTPMTEVCNAPSAQFRPRYYSGDLSKTILPGLDQQDRRQRLRKNWTMGSLMDEQAYERVRKQWRNSAAVEDLITADPDAWAVAYASYLYYRSWFKQTIYMDMVQDPDSARALLAQKVKRYAFQRPQFQVEASPRVAEILTKMDVVWLVKPELVKTADYCVPGTQLSSEYAGMWAYKCAVLSVQPDGETRVIRLEALRQETLYTTAQELEANPLPQFRFNTPGAGWNQGKI